MRKLRQSEKFALITNLVPAINGCREFTATASCIMGETDTWLEFKAYGKTFRLTLEAVEQTAGTITQLEN